MGLTPPFSEGTKALYELINENKDAMKYFGGGDTLQEFKTLLPEIYNKALSDEKYYFFAGGGTILKAIKEGGVLGLEPVKRLIENRGIL
jgi:phosphoglycerate kinase